MILLPCWPMAPAGSPNRDSDTPSGPRLLLIGKSLTTMTYPHVASHYGLPFVLLTPVLHHADFDPSARVIPVPAVGDDIVAESEAPSVAEARAIIRAEQAGQSHAASSRYSGPAPLIRARTADPFYDQARANALTPHVHEYPDANHSIEVPGHWRRSLDHLKGSHRVRSPVRRHAVMPRDTPEFCNVADHP